MKTNVIFYQNAPEDDKAMICKISSLLDEFQSDALFVVLADGFIFTDLQAAKMHASQIDSEVVCVLSGPLARKLINQSTN